jgi:hypothetical protein
MENIMAMVVLSFTLPTGTEVLKQYAGKAPAWIDTILSAPGAKEFRAYRSTDGKEAITLTELDTVVSADKFIASDKYKTLRNDMEKAGCSNFHVRTWDTSPLVAKPVRPRAAAA